ncbi:MAG: protein-L-isoaspartate(D-aspartate) O-methyltransferase [Spirochaetota bacterium]|nr:protein-L-isoaspartate(D-aspartate) O-methyltransferase [Spirochaetota bacterium]
MRYKLPAFLILILLLSNKPMIANNYDSMRQNMVKYQLKARGIRDPLVLSAMSRVKRHLFVPSHLRGMAYRDEPLPIGHGQTISQPYMVALMTELLKIGSSSKVLEIGTGSGYQAAVLAEITKKVYSVELVEALGVSAAKRLKKLGYTNVHLRIGDGYLGWKAHSPYDAIIVTCGADKVPPALVDQLKVGGILCIPVGPAYRVQRLLVLTKKPDGSLKRKVIADVLFVPLVRPKK